jgi:hypothetical protein
MIPKNIEMVGIAFFFLDPKLGLETQLGLPSQALQLGKNVLLWKKLSAVSFQLLIIFLSGE